MIDIPLLAGELSDHPRPKHLEISGFRVIRECWMIGPGSGSVEGLKAFAAAMGGGDDDALEFARPQLA